MKKFILGLLVLSMIMVAGCANTPSDETLTFVGSKVITAGSDEFVALIFDYTNESGKTKSADDAFDVDAFQNGIELNCSTFSDEFVEGAIDWFTQVQTGHTAKVVWFFPIGDGSPISVEVSNGKNFTVEVK